MPSEHSEGNQIYPPEGVVAMGQRVILRLRIAGVRHQHHDAELLMGSHVSDSGKTIHSDHSSRTGEGEGRSRSTAERYFWRVRQEIWRSLSSGTNRFD